MFFFDINSAIFLTEHELADSLGEAIAKNPKSCAILVRRHGMYVWGDTWEEAKRHGECLHYLFEIAINMHKLGLDFNSPPKQLECMPRKRMLSNNTNSSDLPLAKRLAVGGNGVTTNAVEYMLFDIEGTTTPITFVKDVLFPFAASHVKNYLQKTWHEKKTMDVIQKIADQAAMDIQNDVANVPPVNPTLLDSVVNNVLWNIKEDRKIASLKDLQGYIWDEGYTTGSLKSIVYPDVVDFFSKVEDMKLKIAIYSSGSRDAQKLLFKYSNHGDLRKFISCYFDTIVGNKREAASYTDIVKYLGVDSPSNIMFVTDIIEEAIAAKEAGLQVVVSIREGNAPLPTKHEFRTVTTFDELVI